MKTSIIRKILIIATVAIAACGNTNSGVNRSKRVDALSATERSALCTWQTNEAGGPGIDKDCGAGVTAHIATIAECESEAKRTSCTVGEVEDCLVSLQGDLCAAERILECKPECVLGIAISLP